MKIEINEENISRLVKEMIEKQFIHFFKKEYLFFILSSIFKLHTIID